MIENDKGIKEFIVDLKKEKNKTYLINFIIIYNLN